MEMEHAAMHMGGNSTESHFCMEMGGNGMIMYMDGECFIYEPHLLDTAAKYGLYSVQRQVATCKRSRPS